MARRSTINNTLDSLRLALENSKRGLTVEKLAKVGDISESTVSNYLTKLRKRDNLYIIRNTDNNGNPVYSVGRPTQPPPSEVEPESDVEIVESRAEEPRAERSSSRASGVTVRPSETSEGEEDFSVSLTRLLRAMPDGKVEINIEGGKISEFVVTPREASGRHAAA